MNMNYLFTVTNAAIEALIMIFCFNGFMHRKQEKYCLAAVIGLIMLNIAKNIIKLPQGWNLVLSVAAAFIVSFINYTDKKSRKIFSAVIYIVIMLMAEIISGILLSEWLKLEYENVPAFNMELMASFTNMISFIFVLYAVVILRKKIRDVPLKYWVMMLFLPIFSAFILIVFDYLIINAQVSNKTLYSIILVIGLIYVNVMFFDFFETYSNRIELKALRQKEEYEQKHAKEINEMYARTCAMRHDLLHHFETVKGLLGEDSGKAKEYIQSVTDEQIRSIRPMIKTDNDYFDAIANAKLAVCDSYGIKVTTRIQEGALAELNNSEIASLFGNLFDNAIEASKNSRQKRIELDVQRQKGQISVFMRNTIDSSVLEGNSGLKTTKANKELHGLGTKNIKRIVDKHNGIINYFEEDGYFCCDILM